MSKRIFEEVREEYDADTEDDTSKGWEDLFGLVVDYLDDVKDAFAEDREQSTRENLIALATITMRLLAKLDAEGLP